jgi:3-deoxy-manno-octulosonate cytidylyltransferase (CMP-KDO synthetase)
MIIGIIPARYSSTRFPGKPLINIKGKSMIERVYEQSIKSKSLNKVIVATDDDQILNHVLDFGGQAIMTHKDHASGTDRCFEALSLLKESYQYIINIQGDEPFIEPAQIDELAETLNNSKVEIATQMIAIKNESELFDPGEAKIILNKHNEALYFSRAAIPYLRNSVQDQWHIHHTFYRQVGMYAYRNDILKKITKLPVSTLEKAESLEQLRWLQNGFKIKCVLTKYESHCVDVPEDVERILRLKKGFEF